MISRRVVWAMRDARRRLGQAEELFFTRPLERSPATHKATHSESRPEFHPGDRPQRRQPDGPVGLLGDRTLEELAPQTTIERGI